MESIRSLANFVQGPWPKSNCGQPKHGLQDWMNHTHHLFDIVLVWLACRAVRPQPLTMRHCLLNADTDPNSEPCSTSPLLWLICAHPRSLSLCTPRSVPHRSARSAWTPKPSSCHPRYSPLLASSALATNSRAFLVA